MQPYHRSFLWPTPNLLPPEPPEITISQVFMVITFISLVLSPNQASLNDRVL